MAAAFYHAGTWFNATQKAMPLQIGEEFVKGSYISGAHYAGLGGTVRGRCCSWRECSDHGQIKQTRRLVPLRRRRHRHRLLHAGHRGTRTFLAALGHVPPGLSYESLRMPSPPAASASCCIFGVIALSLWSSAHRLRCTCYDFGLRADTLIATVLYVAAIAGSIASAVFLLRI
jgi:fumarate reductase subunit D